MFQELRECFDPVLEEFFDSSAMRRVSSGNLSMEEYRSYLKQTYYYVRENPQLQALATVYFRGRQRELVRNFYAHASSEIGHEQLALNDYVTLGGDATNVPYRNPLPATTALTSFAFYQIYNKNPLGYLGYLFFLEFTPTQGGPVIAENLVKAGIPTNAMTFLQDHIEIDVGHNKLMEKYADSLLSSKQARDSVVYAIKTTGYLFAQMIDAAFDDASKNEDTGWDWEELAADDRTPAQADIAIAS